jgi:hypothetical protein
MMRFAAAVALSVVSSMAVAKAAEDNSSSCPPATRVQVVKVSATAYTMQISARNTCTCPISFEACSSDEPKPCCDSIEIGPGQTGQLAVVTYLPNGKADYHWRCSRGRSRR